ncbi:hypothetical protein UlMin_036688 [Ulmus minor]
MGRGSAVKITAMVAMLLCIAAHLECVHGASYTVGNSGSWTFNTDSWPRGKRFKAGDVLIFNYDPKVHNVVQVDRNGYTNCKTPGGAKVYRSGKDQIKLVKGQNYFICNFPGHCQSNMKIAINAQ